MTMTKQNKFQGANKAIKLLSSVAALNSNQDDMVVFNSENHNVAYAGTRKYWGASDLFVRYSGNTNNQHMPNSGAVFNVITEDIIEIDGLLGARRPDNKRDLLTPEGAERIFEEMKGIKMDYVLKLNPRILLEFIESKTEFASDHTKTISIMPTGLINSKGHSIGFIRKHYSFSGEQIIVEVPTPEGIEKFTIEDSLIDITEEHINKPIMFNYVGEVMDGASFPKRAQVIMEYEPGIHVSIQDYPAGHVLPIFDNYSVIPGEDGNSLSKRSKTVIPFFEDQEKGSKNKAPILTFSLANFKSVLYAMEEFREFEIHYRSSVRKCYITTVDRFGENDYKVEAVIAPLAKHKYGKILMV